MLASSRRRAPGVRPAAVDRQARDSLPLRDPAAFRAALDGIDEDPDAGQASIVAHAGLALDATGRPVLEIVAGHCARSPRRIALVDLPADAAARARRSRRIGPARDLVRRGLPPVAGGANPLGDPPTVLVPPSGSVAGLSHEPTSSVASGKLPPAGARRSPVRSTWPSPSIAAIAALTQANVNAIRRFAGGSPVAWGARTLASPDEPDWKYVERPAAGIFLEHSIDLGIRWAVFEPNAEPLWTELRREVEDFMTRLWHQGGLLVPARRMRGSCTAASATR